MQTINLPCFGIILRLYEFTGSGTIQAGDLEGDEFDGMMSLILAHACAGIDVETPAYIEGIETAANSIMNHA